MTADELRAVLEAADVDGCIALFATATERERRAVAKVAAEQLKKLQPPVPRGLGSGRIATLARRLAAAQNPDSELPVTYLREAAQAAVLATATLTELKKLGHAAIPPADVAVSILSSRRPPWIGEWAEVILSKSDMFDLAENWLFVRRLVQERFCERPRSARATHAMLMALERGLLGDDLYSTLRADDQLRDEEIWDVFEFEPMPGGQATPVSYSNIPDEYRWEVILAKLAGEGRMSRARLLDASLGGLEREFPEMRARWYALTHEAPAPTIDERAARVDRYLGLAGSRNPSTVTFALKALALLERAGRVEPRQLLSAVRPALQARAKGTARAALDLVARAVLRDSGLAGDAAAVAVEALSHESPDVQAAVLDLIERHGDRADRGLEELLRARAETISPSQRARLAAWLGSAPGHDADGTLDLNCGDLLGRAAALDPSLAALAGVAAASLSLKHGDGLAPAISFAETEICRLDPQRAIVPVDDLDQLIALFLEVLENTEKTEDVERVLDGVSRLCDRRPHDFAARTDPLKARAYQHVRSQPATPSGLLNSLCGVAIAWVAGQPPNLAHAGLYGSVIGFFARRCHAIARRAAAREAAPLQSAPTHERGLIDPRMLVERLKVWSTLPYRSDRLDGALALLRLAPDRASRVEALQMAAEVEGPFAGPLRHALGGEGEIVGLDARLWVAAARARSPNQDDPGVEARHPGLGPDTGRVARCSLAPGPHPIRDWIGWSTSRVIVCDPPLPLNYGPHDLPTLLLHQKRAPYVADDIRWMATIWPLGQDSFFAAGAERLLASEWSPMNARDLRPFLEMLIEPDVPLRTIARLLLAGSLASNLTVLQGLAVDALVASIDDGRIDGKLLGEAIHRVLADELVKTNRLTKALSEAARVSVLHNYVIAEAVQRALPALAAPPRDLHLLLELLNEVLCETGERLAESEIESFLRGLKVSGKTAKLARDLLALTGGADQSNRMRAAARALVGRVERAERWMRCCGSARELLVEDGESRHPLTPHRERGERLASS
jgi:hypothetical protein